MGYICWLEEIGASHLDLVGGKGANLGELTQAGLPVPPGFCVTSTAYQDHLKATQLDQLIEAALAEINLVDREDIECQSAQIREAILTQPILPEIAAQVTESLHQLLVDYKDRFPTEVSFAVRSSASAEDQTKASFAGQLDSYLNIRGERSVLEHIRLCWASLWNGRVVAYIAKQGLDQRSVSMSVLVQAMIPSEFSGVLFTANPITGKVAEVVINASWGLGAAIVSGLVSPDTISVRKGDAMILSRQIGAKELMVVQATCGGTENIPVPENLRHSPVLSTQKVAELFELGNRIEAHYGKPQDIEWGFYRGQWYILQSRPITTLLAQSEKQYPKGEFNRSMFIEIFPDPLSPVFLSVIEHLFKDMLDFTFRAWGFKPPRDIRASGVFYNQIYFNRDYISGAFQPLSAAMRESLTAQVVNPFGHELGTASIELSLSYVRMVFRTFLFMIRFPRQLPSLLADYRSKILAAESYPYERACDIEISKLIRELPFEHANELLNNDFLMIAVIGRSYRLLGAFLKRYYGADTDEVVAKLISGVTGNVTMETNKSLWNLAQIARSFPEVSAVIREYDHKQARGILEQFPQGRAFLKSLDTFLVEYGHREVRLDILYPTWCEDPEPVFSFMRSFLDADEAQSPYRQQERLIKEREQLTKFVMKDIGKGLLGCLVFAPTFKWILKQTQVHTRERDTMHFEMTRIFPPLRQMFLELGKRWAASELLDQEEDIFFLKLEEIEEIATTPRLLKEAIQARKKELCDNQYRPLPNIIRNGEEIFAVEPGIQEIQNAVLRGVPGSPGRASGISRVILRPEEFGKLKRGEILVAPFTTPVWTPLFALAGGLVTEVGGILSHGAIVAREYGIPAVMSATGATKFLQDGQCITVDGNTGLIHLEMEA